MEEREIVWDIPGPDGSIEHLSPEILRNRIEHLRDEVSKHRLAIQELIMLSIRLTRLQRMSGEKLDAGILDILDRMEKLVRHLYGPPGVQEDE